MGLCVPIFLNTTNNFAKKTIHLSEKTILTVLHLFHAHKVVVFQTTAVQRLQHIKLRGS